MLAEIFLDIEFKIQEITILLLLIQELKSVGFVPPGREMEPLKNLSLFLTDKAIVMAQLHEA